MNTRVLMHLLAVLLLLIVLCCPLLSCAQKSTGDDDDDDGGDDDDDDDIPDSGVGSYFVHLNMVPVPIGQNADIQQREFYNSQGQAVTAQSIIVSEVISKLDAFVDDAPDFEYEFISATDKTTGTGAMPGFGALDNAVFYESEQGELCIGWIEQGNDDQALCGMENGWIVTHPVNGAFQIREIFWINERDGDQPSHLGQTAVLRATVSLPSHTIVSGSYLKTFVQKDGHGVKIFADMSATEGNDGYDGALFDQVTTFEGDEVFVKGHITLHQDMIEFVPVSAYHVAVLSRNNPLDEPVEKTIEELIAEKYKYAGALVRVNDLNIVDIDPSDETTDWPEYGFKSKNIRVKNTGGAPKMALPIYEGTGIPGSIKPDEPFDAVGAFALENSYSLFPRKIEDINPVDHSMEETIQVSIYGGDGSYPVNLAMFDAGNQVLEDGQGAVPVISIASLIRGSGVTRNYRNLEYKIVAYDGATPFDTITFDEAKSGVLYPGGAGKNNGINSFFWEGMDLSLMFYLNGITDIKAFRDEKPPDEGDAVHGQGVTLQINGEKYAVNFDTLDTDEYLGEPAVPFSDVIADGVIEQFTMSGSFSTDEIRILYDYRLVSYDGEEEQTVRFADLDEGWLVLADIPYAVFPELAREPVVDDVYLVDMIRMIEVSEPGQEPVVIHLRDLDTEQADVGRGEMEEVVFFRTILEAAGLDVTSNMHLFNFDLVASDNFASSWTYKHNHLEDMYFRPWENRGYTMDPDMSAFGGRVSTKAVMAIELVDVPQQAPSIQVDVDGAVLWGADANTCQGCHVKNDIVEVPADCFSCHGEP